MQVNKYELCDQMECPFYGTNDGKSYCRFQARFIKHMDVEECMYFFIPDKLRDIYTITVNRKL